MRTFAQHLILAEFRADNGEDTRARAAFRVCEKVRQPLSVLLGFIGFRSLLARALTLSKREEAWLSQLTLQPDGALLLSAELEAQVGVDQAARGAELLIERLLGLLITFIGEALTIRLLQDIWPMAALQDSKLTQNHSS